MQPSLTRVKAARRFAIKALDESGFHVEEIADALGISTKTVRRAAGRRLPRRSVRLRLAIQGVVTAKTTILVKLIQGGFEPAVIAKVLCISPRTVYRFEATFAAIERPWRDHYEELAESYRDSPVTSRLRYLRRPRGWRSDWASADDPIVDQFGSDD